MNMIGISAVESYVIYIDPQETWNQTLGPDSNYTILIKTDCNRTDIWSWQFTLSYNPNVLHMCVNKTDIWSAYGGPEYYTTLAPVVTDSERIYVDGDLKTKGTHYLMTYDIGKIFFLFPFPPAGAEVKAIYFYGILNGDLITKDKNASARFSEGTVNNTLGELSLTKAWFSYPPTPVPTTSGPGILANITFTVVGEGFSDITLGDGTKLVRYDATEDKFEDIPTTLQHGFFCNIPPRHDVAVASLVAPSSAAIEQPVPIDVNVTNEGTYDESVTLTVYNDTTVLNSTTFPLKKGLSRIVSPSWDTSGAAEGTYEINATATITQDDDLSDNNKTQTITLSLVYDVAVVSLVVPSSAAIEFPVPIDVTVVNEGSYDENVTLTVYNDTSVIDSTNFTLAKGPTSNTVSFSWDTSGLTPDDYEINATATVLVSAENPTGIDEDLSDNNKTQTVTLQMLHDVAVVSLVTKGLTETSQTIGYPVSINATVANEGSYDEDVTLTVYNQTWNESTVIDSTTFTLAKGGASNKVSFSWDTSGAAVGQYTINATATVLVSAENPTGIDEDLSDNNKTKTITLTLIHDVEVFRVTAPRRGNINDNVTINVTVKNTGSFTETFDLTTSYDNATINCTTVTLTLGESKNITVTWNTTGVAPDFYNINATASNITGEANPTNNMYYDIDQILVTIPGDVTGDGTVGTSDLIKFKEAYGSESGGPNWDPYCDLNGDGKVDALDLFYLSENYGKSVP